MMTVCAPLTDVSFRARIKNVVTFMRAIAAVHTLRLVWKMVRRIAVEQKKLVASCKDAQTSLKGSSVPDIVLRDRLAG